MNSCRAEDAVMTARPHAAGRVLLVRHAETDAVGARLCGRASGVPLNARGRAQLAALCRRLRSEAVTAVYSSPLERALDTARAVAMVCGAGIVHVDDGLTEIDFGEWSGLTFPTLEGREDWAAYNAARAAASVPGGESPRDAQARMCSTLSRLSRRNPGTIVVVSHAEPIRYALLQAARSSLDNWQTIDVPTAGVFEWQFGK
jgi:broad specificity phosphatase PhoE